jgi:hypothetical protein
LLNFERQRQFVANLIADDGGDTDRTGLGEAFQPRRDVDSVPKQVLAIAI